jgi:hypothetical protein
MTPLTAAHIWVMDRIGDGPPLSVAHLAAATGLTLGHVALCLIDLREHGCLPPAEDWHLLLEPAGAQ